MTPAKAAGNWWGRERRERERKAVMQRRRMQIGTGAIERCRMMVVELTSAKMTNGQLATRRSWEHRLYDSRPNMTTVDRREFSLFYLRLLPEGKEARQARQWSHP